MRYLGIDYGHKKIGLAISDEEGSFAFPYQVIPNTPKVSEEIEKICREEGVGALVIGESLDLQGKPNPVHEAILLFKSDLGKKLGLEIILEKEYFTTWEAKRVIDESQTDKQTDARAAALILKSYLDKKTNSRS